MGVKNLISIINKYCPSITNQLHNRWKDLNGTTVVLDGTLFTQRFYYGKDGHFIGYLKLLKDLKLNNINLIAVFDGNKRLSQKFRENIRREAVRKTNGSRLNIEKSRLERLNIFSDFISNYVIDDSYRTSLLQLFKFNIEIECRFLPILTPSQISLSENECKIYDAFIYKPFNKDVLEQDLKLLKFQTKESLTRYGKTPPSIETYEEARTLLKAFNIPVHIVNQDPVHEGEALASAIMINGMADYVLSEDTDVLIYGAKLIRDSTSSFGPLKLIDGSNLHSQLCLSKSQLIDFAILSGTDFSLTIPSIGPIRALKFIKDYGSIESILSSNQKFRQLLECKFNISLNNFLNEVNEARKVYMTLPDVPDKHNFNNKDVIDKDFIINYLRNSDHNLDTEVIETLIEEIVYINKVDNWGENDNLNEYIYNWGN